MNRFVHSAALVAIFAVATVSAQWTQWGGHNRNFSVEAGPLSPEWGEAGPPVVWSRPFGDGYSTILVEHDRLYSMRRDGEKNVIAALKADTGETLWETLWESPMAAGMALEFGPGPIASPLLSGPRIFGVGTMVKLHCLDKSSGKVLWWRDLHKEMKASFLQRGYGASPVAYKDTVILSVGGKEVGIVAFSQQTGETVWKTRPFGAGYSSPILVNYEGQDHLIIASGNHRAGIDPNTGEILWHLEQPRSSGAMMSTLNFGDDHLLFGSAAYGDGSRVIQVSRNEAGFQAEEVLYSRRMRIMFGSFVRIGDHVFASSGGFGPAYLTALDIKTGKAVWRKRGFSRASLVHADGKLIILDEDGTLAIATPTSEELKIHSRVEGVLERTAWTPPTLVGTRLYLRNRKEMKVLDLAVSGQ